MSREIKYRGQTRRKGEYLINMAGDKCKSNWVYGGIFPQNNGFDFAIIYTQPECEKRVVYADTVGQYTGIKDKNGIEIYEWDTVIIDSEDGFFTVEWDSEAARFVMIGEGLSVDFDNFYGHEIEIVGNVFDGVEGE